MADEDYTDTDRIEVGNTINDDIASCARMENAGESYTFARRYKCAGKEVVVFIVSQSLIPDFMAFIKALGGEKDPRV